MLTATVLVAALLAAPPPENRAFLQAEGHLSLLSDASDRSSLGGTFGYGVKGGYRWARWGLFAQVEHNNWLASEETLTVFNGALNVGVGFEYLFFGGRARTGLAMGPSILLFDTVLEKAGDVGFFLDARFVGLRWPIGEHLALGLDPLSFALVAPIVGSIPLLLAEYRTVVTIEGSW